MILGTNGFDKDPGRASEAGSKSKKKGQHLKTILRKYLDQEVDGGITAEEKIVLNLIEKGMDGDNLHHIKEIFDRLYGRAMQSTEVSGPDGGPIESKETVINILPVGADDAKKEES